MKTLVAGLSAVLVLGCATHEKAAIAPSTMVSHSAGPNSASALVTTTATVVDVDQKTRVVTLRTAEGEIVHFQADESARNLPQVKKGDRVTATYYESLALRLRAADGEQPRVSVSQQVERAPLGQKPAGMVVRDTTVTARVAHVDRKKQTVTLEGPQGGTVTLKVDDPAKLDRAQVGHLVEATYREAVSIEVKKPGK
jgi:uncharacterized lipoprotein YajG